VPQFLQTKKSNLEYFPQEQIRGASAKSLTVPGPCRYCAHIGAECGVAARPKQRPYYHVSEEEYRCSMQILRHFLQKEDLNLETLRTIAKDLKIDTTNHQQTQRRDSKATDDSPESEEAVQNDSEPDTEEIGDLHEQLGCLMQDSLGEYRLYHPVVLVANS